MIMLERSSTVGTGPARSTSPTSTTLDLLALTSKQQIAATYAAFFGRAADAGGHAFWVGERDALAP
mgnify:CR=1 FL=1